MNAASTSATLAEAARQLLAGRRTIHDFTGVVPERALVLAALEHARWAPNHNLTEPWRFHLIGPTTAAAVAELNAELVAAKSGPEAAADKLARWRAVPGWLLVTCERSADALRDREDYAACCCAVQNLQLFLWAHGVGVKWTTGPVTRDPRFYDLLWLDPALESVVGLLFYGYPAEVPATTRKPLAESLVELP